MTGFGDFYEIADSIHELEQSATAKWRVLNAMNLDKSLSGAPFRVGFYIVKRIFLDTGYLRISRETIADDLGIKIRTVGRALKKLERYIFVNSQRGKAYSGSYYANEYTIDWLYWDENEALPNSQNRWASVCYNT